MEIKKRVEKRSNGTKHTFKLIGELLPNQKDPKSIAFKKANFKGSYWIDNEEELPIVQVEEGTTKLISISLNINTYFSLKEKVFKTTLTYLDSTQLDVTEVQQGTELIIDPIKVKITDIITCELRGHYLIKFHDPSLDTVIWAKWYGETPIKDKECTIQLNLTKTKYLYDRDGQMFEVTKKISFELDNEQVERNVNKYFTILEVKKLNYDQ